MSFTATTTNSGAAWSPDLYTFAPADAVPDALLLACTTVAGQIEGDSPSVRVAYVQDDEAQFTAEGAPIDEAQPGLSEVVVRTGKVSQLVRLSREQYTQTGTAEQLSQSVSRAITRRADIALVAEPAPSPGGAPVAGLLNTAGIIDGGVVTDSLDVLVDLIAELQTNLSEPSHILLSPTAWAAFRKLKVSAVANNESLLGAGTTDAIERLLSLPVLVNVALPAYSGLVLDRRAVVSAAGLVQIATSADVYFDSDSIGLRATWRVGHAVVRPDRVGKFVIAGGGS